ncbi:hypothetical protein LIER_25289 [Lithospermum erythrorhizon]|uniref:Peptidase C14 caspase domain-containing protein n=1 Tax=Lithospermum erythrorhizon TaxID=34254 RepID=A0AAV3R488_LITER
MPFHQALPNLINQIQAFPGLQQAPAAPPTMGRRRAVLCGITYKGHPKSLPGSINDVICMKNFLINKLGFPNSSVILLTDDEMDRSRIPTKMNIRRALHWLVQGCQPGDSLVFHYSGHGSKLRDSDGDEVDGHDESLCPVDYETEGRMLDDEINEIIVRPLPRGATLHAIIDTCFSGTFLDLRYLCRINKAGNFMWEDHRVRHRYKGSKGGTAISISACDDHQTSGDTTAFSGKSNGALTYSFIKTLGTMPKMTYGQLLITMRKEIYGTRVAVAGPNAVIQEPQISATSRFDIHTKNITI